MYIFALKHFVGSHDKWKLSEHKTFVADVLQALMSAWSGRRVELVEGLVPMCRHGNSSSSSITVQDITSSQVTHQLLTCTSAVQLYHSVVLVFCAVFTSPRRSRFVSVQPSVHLSICPQTILKQFSWSLVGLWIT